MLLVFFLLCSVISAVSYVVFICVIYALCVSCFAALWSPAGKGLTFWLLFVMFNCDFVTFPCGILGQVWCLIVLIPDLCHLPYFLITCCVFVIMFGSLSRLLRVAS